MNDFYVTPGTRAQYAPGSGYMNISMDYNAAPSGNARGTEVIIPDNASPAVRAAAENYNRMVQEFAAANGIADYPIRGVRTRSENGRGVANTMHVEPFFNSDIAMQEAIQKNPQQFAEIYRSAFGELPNSRLIAPHGVGSDRGATSSVFGDETSYGEFIANTLLGDKPAAEPPERRTGQHRNDPNYAGLLSGDMSSPQAILDAVFSQTAWGRGQQQQPQAINPREAVAQQAQAMTNALSPKVQKQDPRNFLSKVTFGA